MEQLKFKLGNRCSNNQAKQPAKVKALEVIETQQVNHNEHGTAVIYTDSKYNSGLSKERQKPQPPRRKNQEDGSNP